MKKLTEEIAPIAGPTFDRPIEEKIIDKTQEQKTVPQKNDNTWIWALVGLLAVVIIAYLYNSRNEKTN